MHEHVVGYGEQVTFDAYLLCDDDLKAAHVARISRVFQAILIAFEEKFQEKPLNERNETQIINQESYPQMGSFISLFFFHLKNEFRV